MADYVLLHDGEDVDACIDEVVAARGTGASLSAGIAAAVAAETALREAADTAMQTAIDAKASISDVFGLGTSIATGDNLDNYKTIGVYYCATAAIAASLFNCPSSYTFRLEIKTTNGVFCSPSTKLCRPEVSPGRSRCIAALSQRPDGATGTSLKEKLSNRSPCQQAQACKR